MSVHGRHLHIAIAPLLKPTFFIIVCTAMSLAARCQDQLIGVTYQGGEHNVGAIIGTDATEINLQVKKSFLVDRRGSSPLAPVIELNGRLYGTTQHGGSGDFGLIYSFDPGSNDYKIEAMFDEINTGKDPEGGLTISPNGKMYGMTYGGAEYGLGAIFEFDPSRQSLSKKIAFDTVNGGRPRGRLMLAADGKLYGMTSYGGVDRRGVIFSYVPETNGYTKLKDLSSTTSTPYGDLLEVSDGRMFGTSGHGGTKVEGAVIEFNSVTQEAGVVIDFQGGLAGSGPGPNLLLASNGKIYGVANGGTYNSGLIFELDPSDSAYSKIFDFNFDITGSPASSLIEASNGKFYGVTSQDQFRIGLFEFDPAARAGKVIVDFDSTKGSYGASSLMQASNGKLYGTCLVGGLGNGVLFEYEITTDKYTVVVNFNSSSDGVRPRAPLVQGLDKKIFGTTESGGALGKGILFEYDLASDAYEKQLEFESYVVYPETGLLFNRIDGDLYGYGSDSTGKFLFAYDPTANIMIRKKRFSGTEIGAPEGALVQSPEGRIFGVTRGGGNNNMGVLFEYDVAKDTIIKKFDFDGLSNGRNGTGYMVINGHSIFGTTSSGGYYDGGVLFEFDYVQGAYTNRVDFSSYRRPTGGLAIASNGKIYGVTASGGSNNSGVIYEYDPATHDHQIRIALGVDLSIAGQYSEGGLTASSNGKIYGMTNNGGLYGKGALFEYDYNVNEYKTLFSFAGNNGATPEVPLLLVTKGNQVIDFPEIPEKGTKDPPFVLSATATSGLAVTYTSSNPDVATIEDQTATIIGEGSTIITASQPGDDNYHPAFDKTRTLVVNLVVSIEEPAGAQFFAYPNPAGNELVVQYENMPATGIRLTDVFGKLHVLVPEEQLNNYRYRFNTSGLTAGLYILTMPGKAGNTRIMIEK